MKFFLWFFLILFYLLLSSIIVVYYRYSFIILGLLSAPLIVFRLSWILTRFVRSLNFCKINPIGKAILITGCDTGFGHESALLLNKSGFRVFACCLFPDGQGAKELTSNAANPDKMHIIKMDVTNDVDVNNSHNEVESILSLSGDQLYGLLNNAGIIYYGNVEFGNFDIHFQKMMEVNVLGIARVTRKYLPLIRESRGRIVIISSLASRVIGFNLTSYCCSKYAARAFAEGLRREVDQFGVKVIDIEPSYANTALIQIDTILAGFRKTISQTPPKVVQDYGEKYQIDGEYALRFLNDCDFIWQKSRVHHNVVLTIRKAFMASDPFGQYLVLSLVSKLLVLAYIFLPESLAFGVIHKSEKVLLWCYKKLHRSPKTVSSNMNPV